MSDSAYWYAEARRMLTAARIARLHGREATFQVAMENARIYRAYARLWRS